jgi:hypothetical protein
MRLLTSLGLAMVLTGIGLAAPAVKVAACTCAPLTPEEVFAGADVVFVGRALHVEAGDGGELIGIDPLLYRFAVEERRKGLGLLDRDLAVATSRGEAACGATFEIGARYLVNAHWFDGRLSTSLCSQNQLLAEPSAPGGPPLSSAVDGGVPQTAILVGLGALALMALGAFAFLRR